MSSPEHNTDSSGSRVTNNPYSAPVEVGADASEQRLARRRRHGVIGMILGTFVGGMLLGDISILEASGTPQTTEQAIRSTVIFGLLLTVGTLGGAVTGRAIAMMLFDASASQGDHR